ncbi:MAG: alpha/beta hydrolase, partial [Pseudomonadota bacterium]|nr:alpha/beta hydrolase [Pseudomonadota bacterium]
MPTTARHPLHRTWSAALALAVLLSLGGCRTVWFGAINSTDQRQGIMVLRDQAFDPAHRLALDVYRPADARNAPVVVFFHGGDWTHGKRQWYRFVGTALAARGVITVIPDYREYPRADWHGFMRDAADAVAWAHAHASRFGGDPRALFVMGHSSGGQIAGLLATDPSWLAADGLPLHDLAGFIGLAGVYHFVPLPGREAGMRRIFGQRPGEQRQADPYAFVHRDEPPMLLLQGTADHQVDPAESIALARKAQAIGDDAELKLYPGVGHMALVFALTRPMRHEAPTLEDVLAFIDA